jgi:XFP N-terminal domain
VPARVLGTTPGLNLLYAHMNRVIKQRDLNALYVTGPGHGGLGLVTNACPEGTYSEVYSSIGQDEDGMRALFRQFSFPGGIPSHVAPKTPGSIHEGASSAMRWCMPTARRSTTRICWCCAWWATGKSRPARWPPAGTRASSSTPSAPDRYFP